MARVNIFNHAVDVPSTMVDNDATGYTMGVSFISKNAGTIYGIHFYRNPLDTSTSRNVALYLPDGTVLATDVSVSEAQVGGWLYVPFTTPYVVTAGQRYIAAALMYGGHYVATSGYFNNEIDNADFYVNKDQDPAVGFSKNGLYDASGSGIVLPTNSFNATNYWVDVEFELAGSVITGSASIVEQNDTVAAAGKLAISGSSSIAHADDTMVSTSTLALRGAASIVMEDDGIVAAGALSIQGTLSALEADDTVSAQGAILVRGAVALTDADDIAAGSGKLLISGMIATIDADDVVVARGSGAVVLVDTQAQKWSEAQLVVPANNVFVYRARLDNDAAVLAVANNTFGYKMRRSR